MEVNPTNGTIGIVYHDRGASNGTLYNAALAEGMPGALVKTTVSTAPSDPVHSIFFQADEPGCEMCAHVPRRLHQRQLRKRRARERRRGRTCATSADADLGDGFAQFIYFARK